jgi:hypothetical protein
MNNQDQVRSQEAREAVATAAGDYTENDSITVGCSCRGLDSTLDFIRDVNAQLAAPIAQKGVAAHG